MEFFFVPRAPQDVESVRNVRLFVAVQQRMERFDLFVGEDVVGFENALSARLVLEIGEFFEINQIVDKVAFKNEFRN